MLLGLRYVAGFDSSELAVVGADGSDSHRIGIAGGNVFDQPGDLAWQPIWP